MPSEGLSRPPGALSVSHTHIMTTTPTDLQTKSARELREMCELAGVGTPEWRRFATKEEMIAMLAPTVSAAVEEVVPIHGAEATPIASSALAWHVDLDKVLRVPAALPDFYTPVNVRPLFAHILKRGKTEIPPNTLLLGPRGSGKTSMVYEFAATANLQLLKMTCPLVREPRDWFGSKNIIDGRVVFEKSVFWAAVERGKVVILLDEINRADPSVLNGLMSLLDHTREAFIQETRSTLRVGEQVYFWATANEGAEYTGVRGRIDAAIDDRFGRKVVCAYLEPVQEVSLVCSRTGLDQANATKIVTVANAVRNNPVLTESLSTRGVLDAADAFVDMGPSAFEFTIFPRFSPEGGTNSEQSLVRQTVQGQFP